MNNVKHSYITKNIVDKMTAIELNNLCNTYGLTPIEINCIILSMTIDNKLLAFNYTIALLSKAKNKDVLCNRFFHREETLTFINEQRNNFVDNRNQKSDIGSGQSSTVEKQKSTFNQSISSENIKERLEEELSLISDPDKRAVILMKIADFVGLKNSDADDPLTPTIYLPARCSTCNLLKNNQQTNPI